jgi:periplasmic protein TonB
MARDMFDDVVHPSSALGNRRTRTLPLSILLHAGVITALVVAPLMAGNVLPVPRSLTASFIAASPPPEPPPPARPRVERAQPLESDRAFAPIESPSGLKPESPFETPIERESTTLSLAGVMSEPLAGIIDAPPVVDVRPPQTPVRVSSLLQTPKKLRDVSPVYPSLAQSVKVQGVVILEATIGIDGRVQKVSVLRSIPLLDAAAIEAVSQWQYTPTLLNNVPVPVIMTVTVNFTLK